MKRSLGMTVAAVISVFMVGSAEAQVRGQAQQQRVPGRC